MEHYQEIMVALSESVMKNRVKRLLASDYYVIFGWQYDLLISKTMYGS